MLWRIRSSCRVGVLLALGAHCVAAQTVMGVVRDSGTQRPLAGAAVLLTTASDSTLICSAATRADGRFRCPVPPGVALNITARHAGYVPVTSPVAPPALGDSIDLSIRLATAVAILDTVRTKDTVATKGIFTVTPGRVVFQQHMELGKGHFISGFDVARSGLLLSEYLSHLDSLQLVSNAGAGIPVLPAGKGKFLTSTVRGHCLYGRINYWNIGPLLLQRQRTNIDQLLTLDEVIGVEVYLNYHDVPAEWRMDAFAKGVYVFPCPNQPGGNWFWLGDIGLPAYKPGRCVPNPGGGPPEVPSTQPPACPFIQIWTRLSW